MKLNDFGAPTHYQSFPVSASSAEKFKKTVQERIPLVKVIVLRFGESFKF